ncbi:MAG TPA: hypothetical protein VG247_31010 [Pseudonocardiaceae bacterium]|jgi:hypothetical protein|nr:hypothetical protein [Pseudonocardiaceae bacterium]
MSRESESEQPQRTVAELLAEYGNSGEGAPRRRRRRAEDDEEVSGPQAIIDRVLSDSGTMQAIREDPRTGEPIPPASARSHRRLRPVQGTPAPLPPERQAPPQPQQRAPQPPPQKQPPAGAHAPTAYAQPVPPPQAPQQNNPPTGRQQLPPSRPAMPPAGPPGGQPPVSRAPAAPPLSRPAMPPVGGAPTRNAMPPVGPPPGNAQTSRPAMPPVSPPGRVSPPLAARPPVDDYPDDDDFTEQGYGSSAQAPPLPPPPLPQPPAQQQPPQAGNPLQSRLGGPQRPEAAMTEELPPVLDGPPPPQARPAQQPPAFRARPVARRGPAEGELEAAQSAPGLLESTQAHAGPYLDEDEQFESEFPQEHEDYAEQPGYPGERTQYARPPQPPPPPGPRNQGTQLINPNQLAGDDGFPEQEFDQNGYPAANDFPPEEYPQRGGPAVDDVDLDAFEEQPYDRDYRGGGRDLRREDGQDSDDLDDVPPASTGREWLVTGAQVGVGAIAGAAVWLGFSWLWGLMPIAAIVAAVVVVIGLVLVVRKWRKAEDLQTTVLAILAGLVVTVSPAALLLVRR